MRGAEILVAAAADLALAGPALGDAFHHVSGDTVRYAFGGSGALATQIESGAPFDVYLSANERFVRELAGRNRVIPESVFVYALGRLGLWSKSGKYQTVSDLARLGFRYLALPNPALAPYGAAAREFLEAQKIWAALEPKIVYGENVLQAMQFAESGNADAVITAWSLVKTRGGVLLPASGHRPVRQTGAVVRTARQPAAAGRFLKFLAGAEGRAVLESFGFGVPARGN